MSVSNQLYSSSLAGIIKNKAILTNEGEKLVNFIYNKKYRLEVQNFVRNYGKR